MNKFLSLLVFAACIMMTAAQDIDLGEFESALSDLEDLDYNADFEADFAAASGAAATGLVTILLLWILTPVIICVCICVCICACSKTCCFAPKQVPMVMQGTMQPQMMAPK